MRIKKLRSHGSPDLSDYVVHFVGRAGEKVDEVPEDIRAMTADQRLAYILRDGEIRAFPAFGVNAFVVCFSECTRSGIAQLVASGRYGPWGLAFHKDAVFAFGGGPAFYVRGDEWANVRDIPDALRFRATRFWPGAEPEDGETLRRQLTDESDWLHEREWRVRGRGDPPRVDISVVDIAFLIVGALKFRDTFGRWVCESRGPGEEFPFIGLPLVELDSHGRVVTDETRLWTRD